MMGNLIYALNIHKITLSTSAISFGRLFLVSIMRIDGDLERELAKEREGWTPLPPPIYIFLSFEKTIFSKGLKLFKAKH